MPGCRKFLKDCIQESPSLLAGILAFNKERLLHIRPDALSAEGTALSPLLHNTRGPLRLLAHANSFVTLQSPLAPPLGGGKDPNRGWIVDFRNVRHRIALLGSQKLQQLLHWYGLVVHRPAVAGLIDKQNVQALRALVGEEGHLFALRRAVLLPASRLVREDASMASMHLLERIVHSGSTAIAACLADAEPGLCSAVCAMLPLEFTPAMEAARCDVSGSISQAEACWPLVRVLLCKEVAPQCHSYFS